MFYAIHNHLITSCRDGLTKAKEAIKKAKAMGHPAVAITDHASIGGTLDFYDACKQEGIKPILGCEVYLKTDNKVTDNPQERMHLVLLCKNLTGWKNLLKIVRESYDTYYYVPLATWDSLRRNSEGIIATTACFAGPLAMPIIHDKYDLLAENFEILKDIFKDDLYIELQPNGLPNQQKINIALHNLAVENNVPFIVGVDSHYLNPEDSLAQETLLGINMNSRITDTPKHMESEIKEEVEDREKKEKVRYRFSFEKREFWFMSEKELYELWDKNQKEVGVGIENGEAPHNIVLMKAIENLGLIYNKIEEFNIYPDKKLIMPQYEVADISDEFNMFKDLDPNKEHSESLKLLRHLLHLGIKRLDIDKKPNFNEYLDRIKRELKDIIEANIVDYLLIVWDVVNFCNINGIAMSCGRGSNAGSLTTYLLDIHCVDPIEYNLIWERFYNAGRKDSYPDIDLDFHSKRRPEVIEYLISKYGADKVAMICNYSFYRPKSTFKAVCKYYGLVFEEVNNALHDGRHEEEEEGEEEKKDLSLDKLKQEMKELFTIKAVKEMLDIHPYKEQIERDCMAIVGGIANKSVHASGVVITAKPLVELCPVFKRPAKNEDMKSVEQTTEWDMKMLDRSGFLKLDVLGLKTLDIITETNELIVKNGGTKVDWKRLDKSEPTSLALFTNGKTSGVFQFDYGKELQRLCLEFRPKSFSDICALTALGRPGAKSFLGEYMQNRSKSEAEVSVADNRLKPILKETNFVLAYQEQQMEISKQLCGFTLKEADNLRKIVAKKQEDKIGPMREKFINGYIDGLRIENTFSPEKMIKYGIINSANDCTEIAATTNATKIWDAYFSNCEYLFNKSHAVSYSFTSFATAYFKAHHPVEFMTAVLNMNNDGKREAITPYVYEVMSMGIPFSKPSVEYSDSRFTCDHESIIAGLSSIKDISEKVGEQLSNTCDKQELRRRVCCLAKSHYEALILSGACDELFAPLNRRSIFETVTLYHDMASKWNEYYKKVDAYKEKLAKAAEKGKKTSAKEPKAPEIQLESWDKFQKVMVDDFSIEEKIMHETEYLGYAPSDPDFKHMPFILTETVTSFKQKDGLKDGQFCYVYGEITEVKEKQDKNDNTMATIRVHPVGAKYGFYLTVFSSIYGKKKDSLKEGNKYVFKAKISEYMGREKKLVKGMQLDSFKSIQEAMNEK